MLKNGILLFLSMFTALNSTHSSLRFPQLKVLTGLEFRNYQRNLNELVSTFNLAADNVTFRPQEVPLMSFLLVLL